ncbi:hypothetical protein [Hyphomicrobium sp. CS1GBMeth3]|uniref:hypothetical protein n=1 Tax=Hyphomicrobium sp. CS1GBMeth3 TaxID=1892845 RepID=UPI000930687D|nr:hypothetical protein [Hyphomicrobium sp. CS1GBMeth3]
MSQAQTSPAMIDQAPERAVDTSDVPLVGARELALALKILSAGDGLLLPTVTLSDEDLRRVERDFWQISPRARVRKVAVLLRFRSFLAACQTRHVNALISRHGQAALVLALEAAAKMRLNAKWGFNPVKMARAMSEALDSCQPHGQPAAV